MCEICNTTKNQVGSDLLNTYIDDYNKTIDALAELSFTITDSLQLKGCVLFKTHTQSLFDVFLGMLPEGEIRQYFNCNTCKGFFHRYGNLVFVDEYGNLSSIMWDEGLAHGKFKDIIKLLRIMVETSKIIQVLSSNQKKYVTYIEDGYYEYGCSCTEKYHHFHADISENILIPDYGCTPDESRQIYVTTKMTLNDYSKAINRAIAIASTGKLYSSNTLGALKAVKSIIDNIEDALTSEQKANKVWKYAFENYSLLYHLRGSVEGSLMDDILNGMDDSIVIERFNDKMDPMRYMRPTSAPTKALVDEAEKIIADLNLRSALDRRIASINDIIKFIWRKPEKKQNDAKSSGGVFAYVKTKDVSKNKVRDDLVDTTKTPTRITFEKFVQKVLPEANKIFIYDLNPCFHYPMATFVTASDYNAEPILKYDSKDKRNPLSQYAYNGGSYLQDWNISSTSAEVIGIAPGADYMNKDDYNTVIFIIDGCRDTKMTGGSALFPDILRSELYPVRRVIEAYSIDKKLEDIPTDKQAAAGIIYGNYNLNVVVETETTRCAYILDRMK